MTAPLANDRQERFCQEYLIDLNGGRAYERAGYKATGRTADAAAARLLADVNVQARIAELMAERSKRTQITADRVLEELALIAFSDHHNYEMDDRGLIVAPHAPEGASRAIAAMKRKVKRYKQKEKDVEEIEVDYKLWNKNTALQDLGKHLGLFGPTGTNEDPIRHAIAVEIVNRASNGG